MKMMIATLLSLLTCIVFFTGCGNFSVDNREQSLKVYSFSARNEFISVSNGVIVLDDKDEFVMEVI